MFIFFITMAIFAFEVEFYFQLVNIIFFKARISYAFKPYTGTLFFHKVLCESSVCIYEYLKQMNVVLKLRTLV